MDVQLLTQPISFDGEKFLLGDKLISLLTSKRPKYNLAEFMFGTIKPNALEKLKPYFAEFISNGGEINFYIGLDKKSNSKSIISELLSIGCNIFIFSPEDTLLEFNYKSIILKASKKADIFLPSGNFSLGGLFESATTTTYISYDLTTEKTAFDSFRSNLLHESLDKNFSKIYQDDLEEIYAKKPIPSVKEFTASTEKPKTLNADLSDLSIQIEIDDGIDFTVPVDIPKPAKKAVKSDDIEIESNIDSTPSAEYTHTNTGIIDYPTEPVYYGADDALDVEEMLFASSSYAKNSTTSNPSSDVEIVETSIPIENKPHIIAKPKDTTKTSIFMFEAPKITSKGICKGEIKLPVSLRDITSAFWEWPTSYTFTTSNLQIKSRVCKFNIVDTKSPEKSLCDQNVRLFQREAEVYFTIHSSILEDLSIEENDIIRLIKVEDLAGSYYTCEIIRKDAKEYDIWSQFLTEPIKGSKRRYGIM